MKTTKNITTELTPSTYGYWTITIMVDNMVKGFVDVYGKTQANKIIKSKKQLENHIAIFKCFV